VTFRWTLSPLLRSVETDDIDIEMSDKEKRTGLENYLAELHSTAEL
jgi:hypothetical protein